MINKDFISIDINAAKKIVQSRDYQSTEYRKGAELASMLKTGALFKNNEICSKSTQNGGVVIYTDKFDKSKTLIFDLAHFTGFEDFPERECLILFQKSCRLAIKVWEDMGLSSMERAVDNRYIILLPFSFRTGYYKVGFDKNPDEKRQAKREINHFLIFKSGNNQFDLMSSSTNFRKALDSYKFISNTEEDFLRNSSRVIEGFTLDKPETEKNFVGFGGVEGYLTEAQKKFIRSCSLGPSVLEGAAGTGKTLSLILRCIDILKRAQIEGVERRVLFITHSSETKSNIESLFGSNGGSDFIGNDDAIQKLYITTLQEWCIDLLGSKISETEYLDSDARDSKETQLLYLNEIFEDFKNKNLKAFSKLISRELYNFFDSNDSWAVSEMLQHEISVYIKGRANEELDRYKKLERSEYAIPIRKQEDFECLYSIYNEYHDRLLSLGQFDSDDIVLTAIGELETPIWRRRRIKEGFDTVLIDETHLFNLNELCVFHYLTKPDCINNIIFTIDRSQALGDSTLTASEVNSALRIEQPGQEGHSDFKTVFRSSPDIISLASHILSSGATLFTNLENPLLDVTNSFTMEDEKKSVKPYLKKVLNDDELLQETFSEVDLIAKKIGSSRCKVIIIPSTDQLLTSFENYAEAARKPYEIIKKRGDYRKLQDAQRGGKFLLSGMDYVGGLEFDAAIIVGADKGRLPPIEENGMTESKHYLTYSSYNRLYVAVTRAKYAVCLIYSATRGVSMLLDSSIKNNVVDVGD